jgi:hypothetical protein
VAGLLAVALQVRGVNSTPIRRLDSPKLRSGERTAPDVDVTPLRPRPRRSHQFLPAIRKEGSVGWRTG